MYADLDPGLHNLCMIMCGTFPDIHDMCNHDTMCSHSLCHVCQPPLLKIFLAMHTIRLVDIYPPNSSKNTASFNPGCGVTVHTYCTSRPLGCPSRLDPSLGKQLRLSLVCHSLFLFHCPELEQPHHHSN